MKKLLIFFKALFILKDGSKSTLNKKSILYTSLTLVAISLSIYCWKLFHVDTSYVQSTRDPIVVNEEPSDTTPDKLNHHIPLNNNSSYSNGKKIIVAKIKYRAKQIIMPGNELGVGLPLGTNLIGKLITGIDTRNIQSVVKVVLPYGGTFKGNKVIPKESVLLGTVSFNSDSERVHINFLKGVQPDGNEFDISAVALSSGDYSQGVVGTLHGNSTKRIAGALGLEFVSGVSEVLQEKEALGDGSIITAKSNTKNALFNGAGKIAQSESKRQMEEISDVEPFVTVPAGSDLIISLTKSFINQN